MSREDRFNEARVVLAANGFNCSGLRGIRFTATHESGSAIAVELRTRAHQERQMDEVYRDGIEPGIMDAGYRALKINREEYIDKIDDQIVAEIRRSRFLVADFTQDKRGARGGVYYEAGFAYGLGIPVIYTCREDLVRCLHLDTRQYNHILWKTSAELRESLRNRIRRVMGDGPEIFDSQPALSSLHKT